MRDAGWFEEGLCALGSTARRWSAATDSGRGPSDSYWPTWRGVAARQEEERLVEEVDELLPDEMIDEALNRVTVLSPRIDRSAVNTAVF